MIGVSKMTAQRMICRGENGPSACLVDPPMKIGHSRDFKTHQLSLLSSRWGSKTSSWQTPKDMIDRLPHATQICLPR
jgi:hypothetical protein